MLNSFGRLSCLEVVLRDAQTSFQLFTINDFQYWSRDEILSENYARAISKLANSFHQPLSDGASRELRWVKFT